MRIIFIALILAFLGCSTKRIDIARYTDEEAALAVAQDLFENRKYDEAAQAFNYVYMGFDFTRNKSYALYMAGLSYYEDGKYDDAIETFKVFYGKYGADSLIPSALYYWAKSYEESSPSFERDLLKTRYALETYKLFAARFPSDPRVTEATERIRECENVLLKKLVYEAQVYKKMNKHESAFVVLATAARMYSNSDYIPEALYEAGTAAAEIGDFTNAGKFLSEVLKYDGEYALKAREALSRLGIPEGAYPDLYPGDSSQEE
ncbi:outer membrane protein assembly factor BamD [candidate division WOR-3 bacterium]|nr:outer membrane protein assembly factor BamD [candidate division WOR-3 bacterium]